MAQLAAFEPAVARRRGVGLGFLRFGTASPLLAAVAFFGLRGGRVIAMNCSMSGDTTKFGTTYGGCETEGVVAIGASAGVIEALTELAAGLPSDLPFAVMVAVHLQVRRHEQVWR